MRLLETGRHVPLMVEAGMVGYLPSPADPFLFNYRNMFNGSMLCDVLTVLGVMTGGPRNRSIGVLGAAQIDSDGNLNTSRLPNLLLTGSGGGNDIASGASEILVTIGHARNRLVGKLDFRTSPGRAVRTIVTPQGVLERSGADEPFRLTRVMAGEGSSLAQQIAAARDGCGWDLQFAEQVEIEAPPTSDEIELCRLLDPTGLFLG
ncbi:MAG: CoA-transferase [Burkholderiaceae bacterium]